MSQLHKIIAQLDFNLHPRYLQDPLTCLTVLLSHSCGRLLPQLGGYLVSFTGLYMASPNANITQFSANLIATATAELLVFVPTRKFIVANHENNSLGRGMFPIANYSEDMAEICSVREFKDGKMVVEWHGHVY